MRTLVIGGTQFMGREVVARLLARGLEVAILHRRDHHDLDPRVENLQADRADLHEVVEGLAAARVSASDVVHERQHALDELGASFGVAVCAPGESMQSMLRRADAAMYEAKESGRARIVIDAAPVHPTHD